jgi:hypothetical protein
MNLARARAFAPSQTVPAAVSLMCMLRLAWLLWSARRWERGSGNLCPVRYARSRCSPLMFKHAESCISRFRVFFMVCFGWCGLNAPCSCTCSATTAWSTCLCCRLFMSLCRQFWLLVRSFALPARVCFNPVRTQHRDSFDDGDENLPPQGFIYIR